jgi:hypothetical protein
MKSKLTLISAVLLGLLLISGCSGNLEGNNPEGVTGGQQNGYGSFGSGLNSGSDHGDVSTEIIGQWRFDDSGSDYFEVLTFNSNGTIHLMQYYSSSDIDNYDGTYSVSGNMLNMNLSGLGSYSFTCNIGSSTLTLTNNYGSTVYHRI